MPQRPMLWIPPKGKREALVDALTPAQEAAQAQAPLGNLRGLFEGGVDALIGALGLPGPDTRANRVGAFLGTAAPVVGGMTVFHGTPHVFAPEAGAPLGRFKMARVGTGEGAQAYGQGLYFAENPNIAAQYHRNLSANADWSVSSGERLPPWIGYLAESGNPKLIDETLADFRNRIRESIQRARGDVQPWLYASNAAGQKRIVNALEKIKAGKATVQRPGGVLTVDIPDEAVARMLDWDAPLSHQPATVREAWEKLGPSWQPRPDEATLGQTFQRLRKDGDPESVLMQAGIPGIKYLDASSRTTGGGTRNFVVFDENLPKILERK